MNKLPPNINNLEDLLNQYNSSKKPEQLFTPMEQPSPAPEEQMFTPMSDEQMMELSNKQIEPVMEVSEQPVVLPVQQPQVQPPMVMEMSEPNDTLSRYEELRNKLNELNVTSKGDLEEARKRDLYATIGTQLANVLGTAAMGRSQSLAGQDIGVKPLTSGPITSAEKRAKEDMALESANLQSQIAEELRKQKEDEDRKAKQQMMDLERQKLAQDAELKRLALSAREVEQTKPKELTKAQEVADREFAKTYAKEVSGGAALREASLGRMDELLTEAKSNPDMFGGVSSYLPDSAQSVINPDLLSMKQRFEELIQGNLRDTLGAQFTEKEGREFLRRTFDTRLSPDKVIKSIQDFKSKIQNRSNDIDNAMKEFESKGSISELPFTQQKRSEQPRKSIVKKQYSASRNQTKVIYSDGTEEVLDGKQ